MRSRPNLPGFRSRRRALARDLAGAAAVLLILGLALAAEAEASQRAAPGGDVEPPIILVPRPRPPSDGVFQLRARVHDESGVDRVTLWVKGEQDTDYRPFQMKRNSGDEYVVTLETWPGRGDSVTYFVEAVDQPGNGPRQSGNPRHPYVARLPELLQSGEPREDSSVPLLVLAGFLPLLGLIWLVHRRAVRDRRRASEQGDLVFWSKLLDPLCHKQGPELADAMAELCSRTHSHPLSGEVLITEEEILTRLKHHAPPKRTRTKTPERKAAQSQPAWPLGRQEARGKIAEEMFWFRLLAPLRQMSSDKRAQAIRELSSRPHSHPVEGKRIFDRSTLLKHFDWVHKADPEVLQARWRELEQESAGEDPAATSEVGGGAA